MKNILIQLYKKELVFVIIALIFGAMITASYDLNLVAAFIVVWITLRVGQFIERSQHDCTDKHHVLEKLN